MVSNKELRNLIEQEFHKLVLLVHQQHKEIMKSLQDILDDVEQEKTIIEGVSALLAGLKQQLEDALKNVNLSPENQEKVDAIFDKIEANKASLNAALTTNTPSDGGGQ